MPDDSEHGAAETVAAERATAVFAHSAGEVDFSAHTLALDRGVVAINNLTDKLMSGRSTETIVAALEFEIGIADAGGEHAQQSEAGRALWDGPTLESNVPGFEVNRKHGSPQYNEEFVPFQLVCFSSACRARFPIDEVIYNCPKCGGLLEVNAPADLDADALKRQWRERRVSNAPLDQSGVWRYREMLPFEGQLQHVVTIREGNTPLLPAPRAAAFAGMNALTFKHQGFNPTGSFKDNGMTCGASQAQRLGMMRVACVSTGNTSASMAAYAATAGMQAVIFLPHGNISYGKLAQALEYGAQTLQVEANFDQILKLVRTLADRLGIYLLNSINPFRIEGQKSIMIEMLDQLDWEVPEWVFVPGGNLGNVSAFGKALRELKDAGFIDRLPRLAVIQAEGSAPFEAFMRMPSATAFPTVGHPETLATAIKIGDPVSWPKAWQEVTASGGLVEKVTETEIADAKAVIGACGIGCEPASAATLAGLKKLRESGRIEPDARVVAVLTGNVLKDPDYIYRYHTGELQAHTGPVRGRFENRPIVVPNDADRIAELLSA
jgi:threonine synthase